MFGHYIMTYKLLKMGHDALQWTLDSDSDSQRVVDDSIMDVKLRHGRFVHPYDATQLDRALCAVIAVNTCRHFHIELLDTHDYCMYWGICDS